MLLLSPAPHADLQLGMVVAGLAVMLLVSAVLRRVARVVRQPAVVGEIAAGIVLGPSLLGLLPGRPDAWMFPEQTRPYLAAIAQVGLLVFMFLIGWRTDAVLFRSEARHAVSVSVSAVMCSFGCGVALAALLYGRHAYVDGRHVEFVAFTLFLGTALAITAFPVLARILAEKNLTRTRVGVIALSAAAVDDVLAWCLLALCSALVAAHHPAEAMRILGLTLAYIALLIVVVRPVLAVLVRRIVTRAGGHVSGEILAVVAAGIFLSSYATTWIGIHGIFGAFAFGLIMPREHGQALGEAVEKPLEQTAFFLLPAFFVVTGLQVDIGGLPAYGWLELLAVIVLACAGKLIGTALPARLLGMPWRETATLSLLMNTRGLTEIVVLTAGRNLGVIDGQLFTMGVLMALITTAMGGLIPTTPAGDLEPTRPSSKTAAC